MCYLSSLGLCFPLLWNMYHNMTLWSCEHRPLWRRWSSEHSTRLSGGTQWTSGLLSLASSPVLVLGQLWLHRECWMIWSSMQELWWAMQVVPWVRNLRPGRANWLTQITELMAESEVEPNSDFNSSSLFFSFLQYYSNFINSIIYTSFAFWEWFLIRTN